VPPVPNLFKNEEKIRKEKLGISNEKGSTALIGKAPGNSGQNTGNKQERATKLYTNHRPRKKNERDCQRPTFSGRRCDRKREGQRLVSTDKKKKNLVRSQKVAKKKGCPEKTKKKKQSP